MRDSGPSQAGRALRLIRDAATVALLGASVACPPLPQADTNHDGAVDEGDASFVETCLGIDVTADPSCRPADVDRNHSVDTRDLALVVERMQPPLFPALSASDPAAGAQSVPRTAWLLLDFASAFATRAEETMVLACGGVAQPFHTTRIWPSRLVVNPDADLPPASACELSWDARGGRASLVFAVAGAAPAETVLYDRSDPTLLPPFPDDYWLEADPSTRTGSRVAIAQPPLEPDAVQLFDALLTDTTVLDGFSPLALIAIELSAAPDPASLPLTPAASIDPLATVQLVNLTPDAYGERVPFQLHVRNDTLDGKPTTHSLVAFPSVPLTPGGRYAFVVTRRVLASPTRPFDASPFFAAVKAPANAGEDPATEALREISAPVFDALATKLSPAIPAEDVALAIRFSIRSTSDLPRDLLAMKEQVLRDPAPSVTITSTSTSSGSGRTTVSGSWQAPNWRSGVYLARDAAGAPRITRRNAVPFTLALPPAARTSRVPVVMYQHGSPGSAAELTETADHLIRAGFAVVGFTEPLSRAYPDVSQQMLGVFGALLLGRHVPDYWIETYGEQMAFLRAIETLGGIDFLPAGAPDGVRELDLSRPLGYFGLSYGANHGQAFLPYAPEIRAAALVTGGTRLAELLFWQDVRDPLATGGLLELIAGQVPSIRAPEVWVGLSIFQMIFDAQDPQNQAAFLYAHPLEVAGTTRKPSLLVVEGVDDSLITNNATASLAWTAGPIPHLAPILDPVPMLGPESGLLRGNVDPDTTAAFVQYAPVGLTGIPPSLTCKVAGESEGHYCGQRASEPQQTAFFLSALDGTPAIVAADSDADADALPDLVEPEYGTDPANPDSDGDQLFDGAEVDAGLDPLDARDAVLDYDSDGLTNAQEAALGTDVRSGDTDRDGLSDLLEATIGTNPLVMDTDGGGRRDGEERNRDHTNPLDASDDLPLVALPRSFDDGTGFRWSISQTGAASVTYNALTLWPGSAAIFGYALPSTADAISEEQGREMRIGPLSVAGSLRLTRKVFVSPALGFVRYLEIVDNDGDAPASGTIELTNWCYRYRAHVFATSSGDAVLTPDDDFFACDDQAAENEAVAWAFSGSGAFLPPATASTSGLNNERIQYSFSATAPPHGRVIVMHFLTHGADLAAAFQAASDLDALVPAALAGMSDEERAAVVNFAVPATGAGL